MQVRPNNTANKLVLTSLWPEGVSDKCSLRVKQNIAMEGKARKCRKKDSDSSFEPARVLTNTLDANNWPGGSRDLWTGFNCVLFSKVELLLGFDLPGELPRFPATSGMPQSSQHRSSSADCDCVNEAIPCSHSTRSVTLWPTKQWIDRGPFPRSDPCP